MKVTQMFLAVTALLCCPACRDKPSAKPPPPPVVEVAGVTQADVPIYHEWIGVLDGLVNAQIRARLPATCWHKITKREIRSRRAICCLR